MLPAVLSHDVIKEVEDAFFDIPFENSDYQNLNFVLAAQLTPARAYRALGLRMSSKLQAIDELKFTRQEEDLDIEEKQLIVDAEGSSIKGRRAAIEISRILSARNHTDKLLNDAIHDLNFMYEQFKSYPRYTREQFELEEKDHFMKSLNMQLISGHDGAVMSQEYIKYANRLSVDVETAKLKLT